MKFLPALLVVLTSCLAQAQYIGFQTRVGAEVDAPVKLPDGSPPGSEFRAQLFRVFDDGTLLPLDPATEFKTDASDARLRFYVKPVVLIVPDIFFPDLFADPIEVTIRMRVWAGADWRSAQWRGESEDTPVLLMNLLFPPANLVGLKGFVLDQFPRISASQLEKDGTARLRLGSTSDNLVSVVIERSGDLFHWEPLGVFDVADNEVAFTDPEGRQASRKFYRVRFE